MFYKCAECGKIIDGYVEKCPECGSKIEMSDSVSNLEKRNIDNVKEIEEKCEVFKKRVKYGCIVTVIFLIASCVIFAILFPVAMSTKLPGLIILIMMIVLVTLYIVICVKWHFFSCPHCNKILRRFNFFYEKYCPYCGKRIRKYNIDEKY